MPATSDQALVVESSFRMRKELVAELRLDEQFSRVYDAKSVDDCLGILSLQEIDLCLIGPSLGPRTVEHFMSNARPMSRRSDCAFVLALRSDALPQPAWLQQHGIAATVSRPYSGTTFREVVARAIARARGLEAGSEKAVLTAAADSSAVPLADALFAAGAAMRTVVESIEAGRLSIAADGTPSLATRDALRLAIETAMPGLDGPATIGSYDNYFVTSLIEWFVERRRFSAERAAERLRERLVRFVPGANA